MKRGYAFVHAYGDRELDDIVHKLNGSENLSRNLRCEYAKGDGPLKGYAYDKKKI